MKTFVKARKLVGFVLVFGSGVFSATAHAMSDCDGLISTLIEQAGGCPRGKCAFKVENGRLVETKDGKVFAKDNATEMNHLSVATAESNAVTLLRLASGRDGAVALKMITVDVKGNKTTSEYGFARPGEGKCIHEQTQRMAGDDIVLNTEFDREFCDVAANAFSKMDPSQAASCNDAMKALVSKYEERGNALASRRNVFRASSMMTKATSKSLSHAFLSGGGGKIVEALQQRDACTKATLEMNLARYRKVRIDPFDDTLFQPNYMTDKRAWPIEEVGFARDKSRTRNPVKN